MKFLYFVLAFVGGIIIGEKLHGYFKNAGEQVAVVDLEYTTIRVNEVKVYRFYDPAKKSTCYVQWYAISCLRDQEIEGVSK